MSPTFFLLNLMVFWQGCFKKMIKIWPNYICIFIFIFAQEIIKGDVYKVLCKTLGMSHLWQPRYWLLEQGFRYVKTWIFASSSSILLYQFQGYVTSVNDDLGHPTPIKRGYYKDHVTCSIKLGPRDYLLQQTAESWTLVAKALLGERSS